MDNKNLDHLRHSAAHLLGAAVLEIWPQVKLTLGPAIEDGFYYDFDLGEEKVSENDFDRIEQKMHELVKSWKGFEKIELSEAEAKKKFSGNHYKLELIKEIVGKEEKITVYKSGEFSDLCRGGHCLHPSSDLKHFKLLSIAGAYWRGSEENKMLTRIYGTIFPTKEELEKRLWQLEEAKKRDHKKLGPHFDLFHFQSEAPGMPFWHPRGMVLRNMLLQFSRKIQARYQYKEVQAPNLLDVEIFKKSGHWDHYKDNMFFTEGWGERQFALRPMDCPGTIQIYKFTPKSYKDLPLRFSEYGTVTRNEKSGELNGLFRVAQITQDDAHIFVRQDQIKDIVKETMKLSEEIYKVFKIPYKVYLSTRPDDFMGEIKTWDKAEESLREAIVEQKIPLLIKEKDGAFYGPKIDYQLEDSLGRTWQCATIQLDFQMPSVFDLNYIGEDGKEHRPVMIHRTIMGSIERFIGILVEHYAGAFPLWLAPVQVAVLPISDKFIDYSRRVKEELEKNQIRVELNSDSKTLGGKIRESTLQKVPYMVIIGDKEEKSSSISVRAREGKESSADINKFINQLKSQIENFS
jgi:threonyl-tRNA synthetase